MKVLFYSEKLRMAISEDPLSLAKEEDVLDSAPAQDEVLEIEELKTYFVKFYYEQIPDFFAPATSSDSGSCFVLEEYSGNLCKINFRNSVGMTRIGPLKVRVKSVKIPEDMYHSILDYIAGKYANLVFSFNRPLGQSYAKSRPGIDIAYIEYLFLKKYLLNSSPDLDGIAAMILANPHMKLHSDYRINSIGDVSSIPPASLFRTLMKTDGYVRLKSGHPLSATSLGKALVCRTGKSLYPLQAFEERRYHTVDTGENRFVKHFLKRIYQLMDRLAVTMKGFSGGYLNPDIEKSIQDISRKLDKFQNDPFWQDVGAMSFIPENSQILQRREGYRQLFSLHSLLQLSTQCDFENEDFRNLIETKDTPTLYEYWTFFLIKDILDGMRKVVSCRNIIFEDYKEQIIKNKGICIQYDDGINLWFNNFCRGSTGCQPGEQYSTHVNVNESYSHELKPDIVVSKGNNLLIFDAKYKGKGRNGVFYGENDQGGISSCKIEDIDKMHTYREAIQNVVGAFILYPGDEAVIYPAHNAKWLYEGVGALPLKPRIGAIPVRKHIDDIQRIIDEFIKED